MNAGSRLISDTRATTSSSSPGGRVSDSMSVTNPCSYSRPMRDSMSFAGASRAA